MEEMPVRSSSHHNKRSMASNNKNSNNKKTPSNPFSSGSRDNFPSLDRALAAITNNNKGGNDKKTNNALGDDNNNGSPSEASLDLSIDARAALHEHLRHVAKFGIDNDVAPTATTIATAASPGKPQGDNIQQKDGSQSTRTANDTQEAGSTVHHHDAVASGVAPMFFPNNTLDEEWEKILEGGNHYDLSFRSQSLLPTFDRLQVLNTEESDDVEVAVVELTRIELDDHAYDEEDYFNSSKVWQLMTPEKNRGRTQTVTDRHNDESDDDDEEEDTEEDAESSEGNTPDSACLVDLKPTTKHMRHHDEKLPSVDTLAPSPLTQSTQELLKNADVPHEEAKAAIELAGQFERNPERVASVALRDFHADDALHNSLLATSIHEDLPIITSPFQPPVAPLPDVDGSFADFSFHSQEHSFLVPTAVTPIRPLPPLSPVHAIPLRSSPTNSGNGSGNRQSSLSGSSSGSKRHNHHQQQSLRHHHHHPWSSSFSSPSSHRTPRGSPARSSTSSSCSFGKNRMSAASPSPPEPDFGLRPEDIASPIAESSDASPLRLHHGRPQQHAEPVPVPRRLSPLPSVFHDEDEDVDRDQGLGTPAHGMPLSPSAQRAANAAAAILSQDTPSLRPRGSNGLKKNLWPSPDSILRLQSTESFESSTVGVADGKSEEQDASLMHNNSATSTHGENAKNAPSVNSKTVRQETKEAMTSSPHVSMDTMSTGCSHHRDCSSSSPLTTRSADAVAVDRRKYRTVVPRRVIFPEDWQVYQHDSFDRPPVGCTHSV